MQVRADALRANYARIRAAAGPDARVMPMVKADAYGLGVREVVARLEPLDPWGFGVATVAEAVALRGAGVRRPVLVCSPAPTADFAEALAHDATLSISSLEALAHLRKAARDRGRPASFHVDVDTGMGRSGFDWQCASEWMSEVTAASDHLTCAGIFTHLHSADDDPESVTRQRDRLAEVLSNLPEPHDYLVHELNSAGVFRGRARPGALVRPGIFLYGGEVGAGQPRPEPVASVHARVVHVRQASPGTSLGYGATHVARTPERWATLSIGYGDGLPRALGNRGSALVEGSRVPIIGRISMDVTVVDITGKPGVREGSVAALIGTDGEESITVDDVAALAGTISYEVLTGLTSRLPRVWSDLDA